MRGLYISLIKSLLMLIILYGVPALYIVTKLSDYFNCGSHDEAPLICLTVVIFFVVILVLLMRIFVFPILSKIETIKNNGK